jgi:hypothetical protein
VGETFIIPKCTILQHKPSAGFTDPTPAFALVAVATDPARRVKIAIKTEFLLMGYEIRITGVHIFGRRWDLLFM